MRASVLVWGLACGAGLGLAACGNAREIIDGIKDHHGQGHGGDGGGAGGAGTGGAGGGVASGTGGAGGGAPQAGACGAPAACTPLPSGTDLHGIWIAAGEDVWAVGDGGWVGHRTGPTDGGSWCWCVPGPTTALRAVWGAADDDVYATGDAGAFWHWNGAGWLPVTASPATTADLNDVWGSAASDVWVVGSAGTIRHFDGTGWRAADANPRYALNAVWGAGSAAVWAVGSAPIPPPEELIPGGSEAVVLRLSAAGWSVEASFAQDRGVAVFRGIDGTSTGDVWAVGSNYPSGAAASFGFAARLNGCGWTAFPQSPDDVFASRNFTDVARTPTGLTYLTVRENTLVVHNDVAGTFNASTDLDTASLDDIDTRGSRQWAAGADGKVVRWDGLSAVVDHAAP